MSAPSILIVEDLPDSIELLKLAFKRTGVEALLNFVRDGEEAIAYLKGEGPFGNRNEYPLPVMLLLDLKMPSIDGFGVLEWLRKKPGLRLIVVVVLTTSDDPADIARAYESGANSYIVKPPDFHGLQQMVRALENYWFRFNKCATSSYRGLRPILQIAP